MSPNETQPAPSYGADDSASSSSRGGTSPEVEELERRLAAFKPLNTRDVAWWYGQLNGAKAVAEDAISRLRASTTTAEAWRPIESAPKDYERVWCHPCRCVGYRVTRGDVHRWVDENRQIIRPSHWMPLPPAPHVAPKG